MSSKKKTTPKQEDAKPALVPKLRFPEFREGEPWTTETMSRLYSFMRNNSLSRDRLNYERGSVKNIHYGDIHTKYHTLFDITKESVPYINDTEQIPPFCSEDYCIEGDLVFADASEDTNDVGKTIEIVRLNGQRLLSGQHTILARRNDTRLILGFGGYLFRSGWIRSQVMKESQGTKVYGISATRLGNIRIAFPADETEQRQIAECLGSVDELMAAQERKVETLKDHKKGLVQQLFPREGETQPRLRFPEFQTAGEWKVKAIGDVFRVTRGEVLSMTLVKDEASIEAPFPVYSSQTKNNGLAGYYTEHLYEDAITWTTDGANAGDVNFRPGKFYCTNVCGVLISRQGHANSCVAALLNGVTRSHVSYVGNPKLMNGVMAKIEIPFPSVSEQQCISSCLSSLDAMITAETQKLAALKSHKKGLMQQLFPSPEYEA